MPYVPVPKDLTKVKTKVVFNLTKRQLICFSLGGVAGLPTYFLTRGFIGNTPALLIMIALMAPSGRTKHITFTNPKRRRN